jgi:hypothetical protein
MTRSRAVLITSLSVVLSGSALALSALVMDPARAAVGPMPAEGLALPADTRVLMGFDMKRFVASPFYARYAAKDKPQHMQAMAKLEEKTGINPERDVDTVIVASRGRVEQGDQGLVLVSGRFDRYKLARAIETEKKVTWKKVEGETVYILDEAVKSGRHAGGLAFLDENTLALGNLSSIEQVLVNRARGTGTIESNTALLELVRQVQPGSAFWMVGDKTALAQLKGMPGAGNDSVGFSMPALESVIVTADLDPAVSVQFTGATTDEASAKNLADVFRGFLALATLQAGQKPELKELTTAVSVATEANKVHVNAKLPYELLDSLQAARTPRKAAELTVTTP